MIEQYIEKHFGVTKHSLKRGKCQHLPAGRKLPSSFARPAGRVDARATQHARLSPRPPGFPRACETTSHSSLHPAISHSTHARSQPCGSCARLLTSPRRYARSFNILTYAKWLGSNSENNFPNQWKMTLLDQLHETTPTMLHKHFTKLISRSILI